MSRRTAFLPWLIWVLSALFVVFNYVQQIVPDVIASDLSHALGASAGSLGVIAGSYFYAYAILQIPVGLIVDRYGTRVPLALAILLSGLGTLAFSRAHSVGGAEVARLVMGASAAFSFIGCLKLVEEWFPPSRFSTLAGMTNTAGMLGAATSGLVAAAVAKIGWRETVVWMGAADLILAVLVFLIVRDGSAPKSPAAEPATHGGTIFSLLGNPQVLLNAVYATCISLVFVAFGGLWGASFIEKAFGLSSIAAANIGSILFFGAIAGSLFFGWYSDFLGRRKPPMVAAGIGALVTMAALLYFPGIPLMGFEAGLFLMGFFSSANIISYAVARDLYPRIAGLSIGVLSTCFFAGGAASQSLVGIMLEGNSHGHGAGLGHLTAGDYRWAFTPLIGFILVGTLALLPLKETGPRAESGA